MAAPSFSIYVGPSTATRMDPCPVGAMVDFVCPKQTETTWTQSGAVANEYYRAAAVASLSGGATTITNVYEKFTQKSIVIDGTYEWINSSGSEWYVRNEDDSAPDISKCLVDGEAVLRMGGAAKSIGDRGSLTAGTWCYAWDPGGTYKTIYVRLTDSTDPNAAADGLVDLTAYWSYDQGTLGSLAVKQWAYGDNDSIGSNRLYVRDSDTSDPDTKTMKVAYTVGSTGDSSRWDQCKITWAVTRSGGYGAWPSKYRYGNDPRPGRTNGDTVDLATAQRGFNASWILSAGDWTISCTIKNPAGDSTTVNSSTITVAADTRTAKYINSATGVDDGAHGGSAGSPYATLVYALANNSADNRKFVVAGGHTETMSTSFGISSAAAVANQYIVWDGTSTIPTITAGAHASDTYTKEFGWIRQGSENTVWEGLKFVPDDAPTSGQAILVSGNNVGLVDLQITGTASTDLFYVGINGGGDCKFVHAQDLDIGPTSVYSWQYTSNLSAGTYFLANNIVDCYFHDNVDESCVRQTAAGLGFNVQYTNLAHNSNKDVIRIVMWKGSHVYGTWLRNGRNWWGTPGGNANHQTADWTRWEACYFDFPTPTTATILAFTGNARYGTFCNNILVPYLHATGSSVISISGKTLYCPTESIDFLHNTCDLTRVDKPVIKVFDITKNASNTFKNNLCLFGTTLSTSCQAVVETGVTTCTFDWNVWTAPGDTSQNGLAIEGSTELSLADWKAKSYVTDNEQTVTTTIDSNSLPTPQTSITTNTAVYDDYYGNARGATSYAGAVNEVVSSSTGVVGFRGGGYRTGAGWSGMVFP